MKATQYQGSQEMRADLKILAQMSKNFWFFFLQKALKVRACLIPFIGTLSPDAFALYNFLSHLHPLHVIVIIAYEPQDLNGRLCLYRMTNICIAHMTSFNVTPPQAVSK